MKKVKITTFVNANNYGASLQAFALKYTLETLGTSASLINYKDKDIAKDYKIIRTSSFKSFFSSLCFLARNIKRKNSFKTFRKKYMSISSKGCSVSELINLPNDADIYITGSDQVWNLTLTGNKPSNIYFLDFVKNGAKLAAYGASIGNEELITENAELYRQKLNKFNYISVREESTAVKLKKLLNKDIKTVLDPTLLLTSNDWNNALMLNDSCNKLDSSYVLVYTLFESEEVTQIANKIANENNLKIVHFRKYNSSYVNELKSLYSEGPKKFVEAFKNASVVITNSFHGTAFSVIYNKQFYSVLPNMRGERIINLLEKLNLENRIVSNINEINNDSINYEYVNEILDNERKKSIDYLKGIIEEGI